MATKQKKKEKKKILKLQQNNSRLKNKNREEKKEEILDFDKITEFNGTKCYVLIKLNKMIESLRNKENDDKKILLLTKELREFAINTQSIYNRFLNNNKKSKSKNHSNKIIKYNLNTTERAFLKSQMETISMEYVTKDLNLQGVDYGAIKAFFQMVYRVLIVGLEDRVIKYVDIYVGYDDELCDANVIYEDSNEKYNLNTHIFISIFWNPLDNLYHAYSIYKTEYLNFSESSLKSLATATTMAKEYESREQGKELISYNGVVLNYTGVLEFELKKLISKKLNLNIRNLKFVDAINYLAKCNCGTLSKEEVINDLHKIRLLRNKVAHGDTVTYEEFKFIQIVLIDSQILQLISWKM